jgi:D-alanyl-D-alanine carboxypeptidase
MKAKKVLSGALAAILLTLTPGVAVCAEEMAGQEQTENTQVLSAQEQENQEKAASYAEKIDTNEISNWPQGPAIYAASGIVMDMNSGAVLYAKKAEEKRYPASITKVLSVLHYSMRKCPIPLCFQRTVFLFCSGMMRRSG